MRTLLFFASMLVATAAQAFATEVWYKLPVSQQNEYWFVAFEEAEFIRSRIGDWLVIQLVRSDGSPLYWRFKELKREANKTEFMLLLRTEAGQVIELGTSPFQDKGPAGQPPATISQTNDDVFAELTMGDGSKRRILFRRGSSLDDLRGRVSISKANLLWKWETAPVHDIAAAK